MEKEMMDDRFMLDRTPLEKVCDGLKGAKPVVFTTMAATESQRKYGLSGQSLAKVFPGAAQPDGMGNYYVDSAALVPVLVAAVNELSARLDSLAKAKPKKAKAATEKAGE